MRPSRTDGEMTDMQAFQSLSAITWDMHIFQLNSVHVGDEDRYTFPYTVSKYIKQAD